MCKIQRAKYFIKAPRQRARGALDVQAQASVTHQMGDGKRRLMTG